MPFRKYSYSKSCHWDRKYQIIPLHSTPLHSTRQLHSTSQLYSTPQLHSSATPLYSTDLEFFPESILNFIGEKTFLINWRNWNFTRQDSLHGLPLWYLHLCHFSFPFQVRGGQSSPIEEFYLQSTRNNNLN